MHENEEYRAPAEPWTVDDVESWVTWRRWQDRDEARRLVESRSKRFAERWGWLVFLVLAFGWWLLIRLGYFQ